MKLDMGSEFVEVDGALVERDALRVAEALYAYDENLRVICLDPARAEGISDAPFIVISKDRNGKWYPILRAWKLDDEVLTRIQSADTQRRDVLGDIVNSEINYKLNAQKRYKEVRELMQEQAKAVVAHQKTKYTLKDEVTGDIITFRDDAPSMRGNPNATRHFT